MPASVRPPAKLPNSVRQQRADADAGGQAEHRGEQPDRRRASTSTEPITWPAAGADRPHQRQLPGALRHDDRERVEDQEDADEQRHAGEAEQDVVEEAQRPPGSRRRSSSASSLAGLAPS